MHGSRDAYDDEKFHRHRHSNSGRLLHRCIPLICGVILAVALIPLSNMGSDWVSGTPAYDLRRTLIASTVAVWSELVFLLATMVLVKRMRWVGR